jgi:CRP-like cAMP-binding protein
MASKLNVPGQNHLVALLAEPQRNDLLARARKVGLDVETVLFDANQPIEGVYFPLTGVVSLVVANAHGGTIEVGTIGNEGVAGAFLALGAERAVSRAMVQIAGQFLTLTANDFRAELERSRPLRQIVRRFAHSQSNQLAQCLACNQLHPVEERICRWLLMVHDRVGKDELDLTQEFIAQMLGVRRATVTVVAGFLQRTGLIKYSRGRITIVDRTALEAGACECYGIIKRDIEQLLSAPA